MLNKAIIGRRGPCCRSSHAKPRPYRVIERAAYALAEKREEKVGCWNTVLVCWSRCDASGLVQVRVFPWAVLAGEGVLWLKKTEGEFGCCL